MTGDPNAWLTAALAADAARRAAVHAAFQGIEDAGLVDRLVIHRYRCPRGCAVGVVIRLPGGQVLCRTRDYKMSHGVNQDRTTESARRKNTLDGDRHWPGRTVDVTHIAAPEVAVDMSCRHASRAVGTLDILATVAGVAPGRPGKPTVL